MLRTYTPPHVCSFTTENGSLCHWQSRKGVFPQIQLFDGTIMVVPSLNVVTHDLFGSDDFTCLHPNGSFLPYQLPRHNTVERQFFANFTIVPVSNSDTAFCFSAPVTSYVENGVKIPIKSVGKHNSWLLPHTPNYTMNRTKSSTIGICIEGGLRLNFKGFGRYRSVQSNVLYDVQKWRSTRGNHGCVFTVRDFLRTTKHHSKRMDTRTSLSSGKSPMPRKFPMLTTTMYCMHRLPESLEMLDMERLPTLVISLLLFTYVVIMTSFILNIIKSILWILRTLLKGVCCIPKFLLEPLLPKNEKQHSKPSIEWITLFSADTFGRRRARYHSFINCSYHSRMQWRRIGYNAERILHEKRRKATMFHQSNTIPISSTDWTTGMHRNQEPG